MVKTEPGRSLPKELHHIKSIALIGASSEPNKVGYTVLRNLLSFPVTLYPINPKHPVIFGCTIYFPLTAIPGPADVVVIVVPAKAVPSLVEEAGKKGTPLVVFISLGLRASGPTGVELEEEVIAIARKYGVHIMGPNDFVVMFPHPASNPTFNPIYPKPGSITFLS